MNFKEMQYIITIARVGTLSRAAKVLFITQPSLSRIVMKVEKSLEISLFDKSKSPWTTTYAGEHYLKKAQEILDLNVNLEKEMRKFSNSEKGLLNIGSMYLEEKYILPALIADFSVDNKDIKVNIIDGASSIDLEQMVLNDSIDFASVVLATNSPELEYVPITSYEILLALPSSHPLAEKYGTKKASDDYPELDLKLLAKESFILLKPDRQLRTIAIETCQKFGFTPKIAIEAHNVDTALAFAIAGHGATFVLSPIVENDRSNKVTYFKIKGHTLKQTVAFVYRKNKSLSTFAKAFLSVLKKKS